MAVIYVYVYMCITLPFNDKPHAAYVYRRGHPDVGWECQPKHVGVYRTNTCNWCAVVGVNKVTQPFKFLSPSEHPGHLIPVQKS